MTTQSGAARSVTLEQLRADIIAMLDEDPETVADDANLLDLGLDSMRAMNLAMHWDEAGVALDFADLGEAPTIAGLWALLCARDPGAAADTGPAEAEPLTEAQTGLWYSQRLDPANPIFNTGQYLDLRGPLDVAAFRAAVDQVGEEAAALSLRFEDGPDGPVQRLDPDRRPRLAVIDLSGEPAPEEAALAAIRADMNTPVDPVEGALAAQVLYRLGPERHLWSQRVHHLVNDGYGMVLLTARVAELYAAAFDPGARPGSPLAPLAGVWAEDRAYRDSAERAEDARWWRGAMEGMEEVTGMAPGRAVTAHGFHRFARPLAETTRSGLVALSQSLRLGWPDVLTGLVAGYCRRFAGTDEIVVGVPHMGRFGSASARVPATVMNVLPLRITPDETAPLGDYLAATAAMTAQARRHGRYRSEQLRRDLGLLGGNRRLYGPLVNVQPYDKPPHFPGLDVTLHVTGTGPVEDISFTFRGDAASGLSIEVDSNPDLYSVEDTAAHGERLAEFLANALGAERLADVPTATRDEVWNELDGFNRTAHPVEDTTLAALIERSMRATPEAEALRFEGQSLSYGDLDRRSAALADALRERGVGAETVVAVALPRSLELVIALVAVLRAGGAYLPLDLDHPAERIATILKSAAPVVVLAQDDAHGLYGERLLPPARWSDIPAADPAAGLPEPQPDDAAYVIYTSGSTGDPKGVVVTHRAIVNRLIWMGEFYGIDAQDRILQKTPATFDVSVWEFFLAFIRGGTLVVAPPDAHRDPVTIATLIREQGITTLHFVPSMLAAFLDAPESQGLSVARVFCSGEELPADLRERFHKRLRAELHNLYGPTEAAVDVSYWPAGPDDRSRPVPIGFPVWNTQLVILDDRGHPVPPGVVGNLYLGGVQLARGYLGRPDLTAERFIDNPFRPGERLYMTGDLARRRADGAVLFLGRSDHQVKIRGLRIELGEIEAAIAASGLTRGVIVLAHDGRLAAYVVPEPGYAPEALRAMLAARLPDYMVPAAFVALDSMPVTSNGKLDRKALPAPRFESAGGDAPKTPTERTLAALYADLLGMDAAQIGRADDFFALGGDSLSAVRLMLRMREEWGDAPGLAALFEYPDIATLAARIDAGAGQVAGDDGLAPLITLTRGAEDRDPLFMVHPAGGICWGYRTLARALSPHRTVHGLQAPALDPDVPVPDSIEALAADYARRIRDTHPEGRCHVAGWSVGGILAQAIAVELQDAGREVGLVAMLDSYPAECWRAEPEPTESQALRALLAIAGHDPERYPHLTTREQILAFLREGESALGNLPPRALEGVVRVVLETNRLVRGHHHRRYDGVLTHVRAAHDHKTRPHLTPSLWEPYGAALDVVSVPFLHPQLTGAEASAMIAPALSERMEQATPAAGAARRQA
ncbi:non-ribosomal peptide synthetase [Pontibaca methylaminivorans]|uniref:Enterobactin synthetase component F n=1 Tax=Pontibaca methylaminivorans TaxID=515897 RepID=A0A1R3X003_9RHOB|nr:non-ribosomal peptide synthetase [Pontibaca methylaminivorans]SIT83915.1 enterobactin synthetase component F [Pontibaca methylaminivorans]